MSIHPTAIIDRHAEIHSSAEIGPFVVIEGRVTIHAGVKVLAHAYLTGWTEIGNDCVIHPHAVIGHEPQDLSYKGAESYCRIGAGTIIREGVSIHRGTQPGTTTTIGERCFLMANSHVAHNCQIGNEVKMANGVVIGGYAEVGNSAFLGGNAAIHQFVRIGELTMIQGVAGITMDLPPFFIGANVNECMGVNIVGLRRAGFTARERREIQDAYRGLYRSGMLFSKALERLSRTLTTAPVQRLFEFLRAPSRRGIMGGLKDSLCNTKNIQDVTRHTSV